MYFAGIDIGSVASKIVIIAEDGEIKSYVVTDTTPDLEKTSTGLLQAALGQAEIRRQDLSFVVSTGYGRDTIPFAQENRTEILCHAVGIHKLFPTARTIIDIGGQDSKVIKLNDAGKVENFSMNTRCAAGTGRFTEVMAKALGISLEQWGEAVASASTRTKISSICTVFAESEVISKVMQKVPLNVILAGVCDSIATRIIEAVQRVGGGRPDYCFTGGVANNQGIGQILEERLEAKLLVPEVPQSTGALGAAYFARTLWEANVAQSDSRG